MRLNRWFAATAPALLLLGSVAQAEPEKKPAKDLPTFGTLRRVDDKAAQDQALEWLKSTGKNDARSLAAFDTIWKGDRPVIDKVADTLALGDTNAASVLAEARDESAPPPTAIPSLLKDLKVNPYLRANLGLAYARNLSRRKVYEEALDALKIVNAESVVDPGAYFFHRAVAEHALMLKEEALDTIERLLIDVPDAPERYRMVGALMAFDIKTWREKDLGWISRKMNNIQRRLELTRGGKKTRKMQKEVVVRLDEMIKELENQQNGNCDCNGGSCPNGGNSKDGNKNNMKPGKPLDDSKLGGIQGKGQVDPKRIKEIAEVWGKLPEKERAKAMLDLSRRMPERYQEAIKEYYKEMRKRSSK